MAPMLRASPDLRAARIFKGFHTCEGVPPSAARELPLASGARAEVLRLRQSSGVMPRELCETETILPAYPQQSPSDAAGGFLRDGTVDRETDSLSGGDDGDDPRIHGCKGTPKPVPEAHHFSVALRTVLLHPHGGNRPRPPGRSLGIPVPALPEVRIHRPGNPPGTPGHDPDP